MAVGYFRLRKIIPAHLKTVPCTTHDEARKRALSLYRTCLRQAGEIQAIYPLDIPLFQIRRRMRQEFEKHRYVDDLAVKSGLLMKGTMELEETLYMWKTHSHVMKYFQEPYEIAREQKLKQDWMAGFLEGRK